jgi:glycosyltransferase involved in cell wall biosynthesis
MKILHVAPINVAGVPYAMVQMHRSQGHEARLVTLHRNVLTFPEDICLDITLPRSSIATWWRNLKRVDTSPPAPIQQYDRRREPPILRPRNIIENMYFRYDDARRKNIVERAFGKYGLDDYDVIHYDGGLDLFRDARIAQRWKSEGKKIVCHYMGSDLRLRGVHPLMDSLADLNLTNESDHLLVHPNIEYIFIPFDASVYPVRKQENQKLRIIHSPSNRSMKGTELIVPVMEQIAKERNIEFLLVENTPHDQVVTIKLTCDIAVEQVGNYGGTGYGRNSLETLAMGIPTVTEMTPDYLEWIPENPFVLATPETLHNRLIELIDDADLRKQRASGGRIWVEKYHSYSAVHAQLMELYKKHGIA